MQNKPKFIFVLISAFQGADLRTTDEEYVISLNLTTTPHKISNLKVEYVYK